MTTTNELPYTLDADERAELISGFNLLGVEPGVVDRFIEWQQVGGPMDDLRTDFARFLNEFENG